MTKGWRWLLGWPQPTPKIESVEAWSERVSKITTPDQIIAAGIMQSFATHPKDWIVCDWDDEPTTRGPLNCPKKNYSSMPSSESSGIALFNKKRKLRVEFDYGTWVKGKVTQSRIGDRRPFEWEWAWHPNTVEVNGIALDPIHADEIAQAWIVLAEKRKAAEEAARLALEAQKAEQAKWDLVEAHLGMKRTKTGALVTIDPKEKKNAPSKRKPAARKKPASSRSVAASKRAASGHAGAQGSRAAREEGVGATHPTPFLG